MGIRIDETYDIELLAQHYRFHWHDMGVSLDEERPEWRANFEEFFLVNKNDNFLVGFSASELEMVIGSILCHVVKPSYPAFRKQDSEKTGYIWGAYVTPEARGKGVGNALVRKCLFHLKSVGCERALLHEGDASSPLYKRMGFLPTSELSYNLTEQMTNLS